MIVLAPERSVDQRMAALRKANEIRVDRAKMKQHIKAGDMEITRILAWPPAYAETMKVLALLMAAPKFGRVKAARVMNVCRISQSKTIGGLSDRQRGELVRTLEERAW